jgi:hypothetical protein
VRAVFLWLGPEVDCEAVSASWWGQPVNTATAFAFLAVAALIWWRRSDRVTATLVALIGVGSIAFHGPMPAWGEFLHDASIAWALVWVLAVDLDRRKWLPWGLALVTLASLTPVLADPAQTVLAVAVVVVELRAGSHRRARLWAIGLLAVGAVVGRLSRTGWPLCDPTSLWQGHGFWHLAAAAALAIWGVTTSRGGRPHRTAGGSSS